jgi:AGZA family xanthine/uracil permease-like MFS transporter
MEFLNRLFKLDQHNTTVRRELVAGLTTFMTMSYIIFVQPTVLSTDFAGNPTGLSSDAVLLATCVSAAIATLIMGLYANYPIALAPGMGENFFFVSVIMALTAKGISNSWQVALGIVFIAGVVFLLLSLLKVRELIINAVSPSLKNGIAVGIGLFIAFIGLRNAGIILAAQGTAVRFNTNLLDPRVLIFFFGLFLTVILLARKVHGAILWGILASSVVSFVSGQVSNFGIIGLPQDTAILKFDILGALTWQCLPFIVIFLFMDMFDTMGTLIGVGEQAGYIKDNKLPRANQALVADAAGTVAGAALGTSTVTSYIESAVGVEYGGRTGLVGVMCAALFLLSLLFSPLVGMIGRFAPITAPALVIVGAMMMKNVFKIVWDDYTEALPAFLILIGIPLSFSIADGLAMGFIAYPVIKLATGKGKQISWLMYVLAVLFIARYIFIR